MQPITKSTNRLQLHCLLQCQNRSPQLSTYNLLQKRDFGSVDEFRFSSSVYLRQIYHQLGRLTSGHWSGHGGKKETDLIILFSPPLERSDKTVYRSPCVEKLQVTPVTI